MIRRIFILTGLLLFGVGTIFAAEGRKEIFEPTTITTPGSYFLSRDIGSSTTVVIDILASADVVDLDLNGFTVARTTPTSDPVIVATGLTSLRVHNGTIQRPPSSPYTFTGLVVPDTKRLIVEDVSFNRAGIEGQDNQSVTIRRNELTEGAINLFEVSPSALRTGSIEDNLIRTEGATNAGIAVASLAGTEGIDLSIRNNRIKGGGGLGSIVVSRQRGCMIIGNRIGDGSTKGIAVNDSNGCLVADNVITNMGLDGINLTLSHDNKIFNNVCTGNGTVAHANFGSGIAIEAGHRNHLDGNVVNSNSKAGIWIRAGAVGNPYGRTMGSGNLAAPTVATCANPVVVTGCPAPYGTGSAVPDLCDEGTGTKTLCDNLLPGPPRS